MCQPYRSSETAADDCEAPIAWMCRSHFACSARTIRSAVTPKWRRRSSAWCLTFAGYRCSPVFHSACSHCSATAGATGSHRDRLRNFQPAGAVSHAQGCVCPCAALDSANSASASTSHIASVVLESTVEAGHSPVPGLSCDSPSQACFGLQVEISFWFTKMGYTGTSGCPVSAAAVAHSADRYH